MAGPTAEWAVTAGKLRSPPAAPPHARGAAKAMPPTRGAILAPHRLKVTYEAPTRTRAKVQQSIDARSACLDAQTVTSHTLTTRSHAASIATPP